MSFAIYQAMGSAIYSAEQAADVAQLNDSFLEIQIGGEIGVTVQSNWNEQLDSDKEAVVAADLQVPANPAATEAAQETYQIDNSQSNVVMGQIQVMTEAQKDAVQRDNSDMSNYYSLIKPIQDLSEVITHQGAGKY